MNQLSEEYILLFQAISQATQALETLQAQLRQAQQQAEELYINRDESALSAAI